MTFLKIKLQFLEKLDYVSGGKLKSDFQEQVAAIHKIYTLTLGNLLIDKSGTLDYDFSVSSTRFWKYMVKRKDILDISAAWLET